MSCSVALLLISIMISTHFVSTLVSKITCTNIIIMQYLITVSICSVPPVIITISDNDSTPIAGLNYSLTCNVSGANVSRSEFHWRKDGALLNQKGSILKFLLLSLSDSGEYTCHMDEFASCLLNGTKIVTVQGMCIYVQGMCIP